jgi:hypothetical protein
MANSIENAKKALNGVSQSANLKGHKFIMIA